MSTLVNRPREEGKVIKPFKGLEVFDDVLLDTSLVASTLYGEVEILALGHGQLRGLSIDTVGYRLNLKTSAAEFKKICHDFGIGVEEIDLVALVRDQQSATLHEEELLKVIGLNEIDSSVVLVERDHQRSRLMTNRYTGLKFEIFLVLNSDIAARPLKPRRKGTILAQTEFFVNVRDGKGGLKPYPLTAEVRENNDLPNSVWLWIDEENDALLDATKLKDAFSIYVDEEILNMLTRLSGPQRSFAMQAIIAPAIAQIVSSASAELKLPERENYDFGKSSSAVLRLIFGKIKKVKPNISDEDFLTLVREKPGHAIAYALSQTTGSAGTRSDMKSWLNELSGETDVPTA